MHGKVTPKVMKVRSAGKWLQDVLGSPSEGFYCQACREWKDWSPPGAVHRARKKGLRTLTWAQLQVIAEKARKPKLCRPCTTEILSTSNHPLKWLLEKT